MSRVAALLAAVGVLFCAAPSAQQPQQLPINVSTDSPLVDQHGKPLPHADIVDKLLQRQVEASVAFAQYATDIVAVAAVDYRHVDIHNDNSLGEDSLFDSPQGKEAWVGVYLSKDRGGRWINMLHPGYPADPSVLGRALPIYGRSAGTDPVLTASGRYFFLGGLYFDRGGLSQMAVSRWVVNNDESKHPVSFDIMREVDRGADTAISFFVDKPHIVAAPAPAGAACGAVYFGWSEFRGLRSAQNDPSRFQSAVKISRSIDCGQTWSKPLNIGNPKIRNQGLSLALAPDGVLYAFWRSFGPLNPGNRIMVARSSDGVNWTKPQSVTPAEICAYDQPTCPGPSCPGGTSFLGRSNGYPSAQVDNNGRVHVVWQQRTDGQGGLNACSATGISRIVMSTGAPGANGALTFSPPKVVDHGQRCERRTPVGTTHFAREVPPGTSGGDVFCRPAGAQFKPGLAFASGKLLVAYKEARVNDPNGDGPLDHNGFPSGRARRHDMRAALVDVGTGALQSSQISQYSVRSDGSTLNPGHRDESRDNLTMFQAGEVPFPGDYEAVVASGGAASGAEPTFFTAWYDTRKVQFPPGGISGDWLQYTPPGGAGCAVGTRDADVFTAEIGPTLAGSPQTFKALGAPVGQVTYVVYIRNRTDQRKSYSLKLMPESGITASFDQFDTGVPVLNGVSVEPFSTVHRTVFASGEQRQIMVAVDDTSTTSDPDVVVRLNKEPLAPDNPLSARTKETHQPKIIDPLNPGTTNPGTINPGTVNPGTVNPGTLNPGTLNPGTLNPGTINPGVVNGGFTDYTDINFTVENTGNTTSAYSTFINLSDAELLNSHLVQVIVTKVQSTPSVKGCDSGDQPRDDTVLNFAATPGTINPGTVNPGTVNPGTLNPGTVNPGTINLPTFSLAPSESTGGSHDGTRHSPALADRAVITVRVWHCRVEGQCGEGVHAESAAGEKLPQTVEALESVLSVAVVAQARDVENGTIKPAPAYDVFGSALDPTSLHFVKQPVDVESGQRVQVVVGSPLPGMEVTLGRSTDSGATSTPIDGATKTTDAGGLAEFEVPVQPGLNLVLTASTPGGPVAISNSFSVYDAGLFFSKQPVDVESGQQLHVVVGSQLRGLQVTLTSSAGESFTAVTDDQRRAQFSFVPADGEDLILTATTAGGGRATSLPFNVGSISFENYPYDDDLEENRRGKPTCSHPEPRKPSCEVSNEFKSRGVTITFTRDAEIGPVETPALLVDPPDIDGDGVTNYSVTAPDLLDAIGSATGVLNLCFVPSDDNNLPCAARNPEGANLPTTVEFRLRPPAFAGDVRVFGVDRNNQRVEASGQEKKTLTSVDGFTRVSVVYELNKKVYLDNLRLVR